MTIPEEDIEFLKGDRLSTYKQIMQHFWRHWKQKYTLQFRVHQKKNNCMNVNELVLLVNYNEPPTVRVVAVKAYAKTSDKKNMCFQQMIILDLNSHRLREIFLFFFLLFF